MLLSIWSLEWQQVGLDNELNLDPDFGFCFPDHKNIIIKEKLLHFYLFLKKVLYLAFCKILQVLQEYM